MCRITIIFERMKDYSPSINTLTIVYVTETSSKMASTLSLKWIIIFYKKKAFNFVYFIIYDFVQISPASGSNIKQIMYGETLDFQCQRL